MFNFNFKNEAIFVGKVKNIKELKEVTANAEKKNLKAKKYIIEREVTLRKKDYEEFINSFLSNQEWLYSDEGGVDEYGNIKVIRVNNGATDDKILVNNEGYNYARYVALEY